MGFDFAAIRGPFAGIAAGKQFATLAVSARIDQLYACQSSLIRHLRRTGESADDSKGCTFICVRQSEFQRVSWSLATPLAKPLLHSFPGPRNTLAVCFHLNLRQKKITNGQ